MMGLAKLSAGSGYEYLTRQVAAMDVTDRGGGTLETYYSARGESPGQWLGAGLRVLDIDAGAAVTEAQMANLFGEGRHPTSGEPLGRPFKVFGPRSGYREAVTAAYRSFNADRGEPEGAPVGEQQRARIRSEVARRLFAERHGRGPADDRELAGFISQESRPPAVAVSGFDLTFSPVKSVSVLWALADTGVAAMVAAAHRAAVEDTVAWLEREVAFTRSGIGGVRQVAVRGLVATAFTHRDSRAGDPDLHTHVAVSNKVQTLDGEGGRWLALDGRVLYKAKVSASERYNTRLEAELVERLGVRFVERRTPGGKRPIREIDGVDAVLAERWSSRRRVINVRRGELARRFQSDHGRPPTPVEALALAQQATLETREPKHEPRSEGAQRWAWRREAVGWFGGEEQVDAMTAAVLRPVVREVREGRPEVAGIAEGVVATIAESRATWQVWHVRAETERRAREHGVGLTELDGLVDRVVGHALDVCSERLGPADPVTEPPGLQRRDGSSVYDVAGSATYTSASILAAEEQILAAARRLDGARVSAAGVTADLDQLRSRKVMLSPEQEALVRELATSGRRVQLALAPAGSGKTWAMRALVEVWQAHGGHVVALAPSASAADEIGRAAIVETDTLAKLVYAAACQLEERWPDWMREIGPRSLVIIDEAGMAGTADLACAVEFVIGRGGSVRLVGDDHQLASVAAGGVLRDFDHHVGAVRLTQVRRFTDAGEAAASLALRQGDAAALGFYADRGRIHVGDLATATDQAYAAWATDRAAGRDAVLLAPTRDLARDLNERARTDRLAGRDPGPEVDLVDGGRAGVGDVVITRHNDRRLRYGPGDWVKNGDRWSIVEVCGDGAVVARNLRRGTRGELPAAYVAQHVRLGYATTVHTAQGITADTCHTVLTGTESRQLLYVAMSRGRSGNHVHLAAASDGDPHSVLDPETLAPSTAIEILGRILDRDESQQSATTTRRDLHDPARRLHDAVLRYQDALGHAADQKLGSAWRAALDRYAEDLVPGLTSCPAYPTLASRLGLAALSGGDPHEDLRRACRRGELDSARDPAAVLDHRLGSPATQGPLPWLEAVPPALAVSTWGDYLQQRARLVADLAGQVRVPAGGAPLRWAVGADEPMRQKLAVWRAAYGVPDSDPRPSGPPVHGAGANFQRSLDSELSGRSRSNRNWAGTLPAAVLSDPRRGLLYERLDDLASSDADVRAMVDQALARGPLPTEVPADALHWRLAVIPLVPMPKVARPRAALRPPAPTPGPHPHRMEIPDSSRPSQGIGPSR